jgi:3-mercaptopyruvate sulfurtransferase SseA
VSPPVKYLAIAALLLASLALFVQNPKKNGRVSVEPGELARVIEREEDHVTAGDLAAMLKAGKPGLRVIDLRDSLSYLQYHIPTAECITLTELLGMPLLPTDTLVLYSEGGIHAAQAWVLLAVRGHRNVMTLKGGLLAWEERNGQGKPRSSPPRHDSTRVKPPARKIEREQEKMREVC